MKTNALVLFGVATILSISSFSCEATVIFSQDFSSSPNGPISQYANSGTPGSGQWDTIGTTSGSSTTFAVSGGALTYTRSVSSGQSGSFTRSTDFAPVPLALSYKFTVSVSGNSSGAQVTAATWQVGDGFSGTRNSAETSYHSRFAINLGATPGTFQFREINGGDSATFSGAQAVTWVINNSGSTLSYLAPDNTVRTVADDKWDLWAGSSLLFDDKSAFLTTASLTDIKFAFEAGVGSVTMDNFEIQAIPEPKHYTLISLSCLGVVLLLRTFRRTLAS